MSACDTAKMAVSSAWSWQTSQKAPETWRRQDCPRANQTAKATALCLVRCPDSKVSALGILGLERIRRIHAVSEKGEGVEEGDGVQGFSQSNGGQGRLAPKRGKWAGKMVATGFKKLWASFGVIMNSDMHTPTFFASSKPFLAPLWIQKEGPLNGGQPYVTGFEPISPTPFRMVVKLPWNHTKRGVVETHLPNLPTKPFLVPAPLLGAMCGAEH